MENKIPIGHTPRFRMTAVFNQEVFLELSNREHVMIKSNRGNMNYQLSLRYFFFSISTPFFQPLLQSHLKELSEGGRDWEGDKGNPSSYGTVTYKDNNKKK